MKLCECGIPRASSDMSRGIWNSKISFLLKNVIGLPFVIKTTIPSYYATHHTTFHEIGCVFFFTSPANCCYIICCMVFFFVCAPCLWISFYYVKCFLFLFVCSLWCPSSIPLSIIPTIFWFVASFFALPPNASPQTSKISYQFQIEENTTARRTNEQEKEKNKLNFDKKYSIDT